MPAVFPAAHHGAGSRLGAPTGRRCRDFRRGENKLVAGKGGGLCVRGTRGPRGVVTGSWVGPRLPSHAGGHSAHMLSRLLSVICHLPFDSRPLSFQGFSE